jgi:uncharacterized protein
MKETTATNIQACEFYVEGIHCASCETLVEKKLSQNQNVKNLKVSLNTQTVRFEVGNSNINTEELRITLSDYIKEYGYTLLTTKPINSKINKKEILIGFLLASLFAGFFIYLQKLGIVNLLNAESISLHFVFIIGVIASLSSCMAVVGGLVLSLSSTYAKTSENKTTPILAFHIARILGFFVLGGLIGLLGSAFTLTSIFSFILNLALFVVMIILGINLLDIFSFMKKFQLRIPKIGIISSVENNIHTNKYAPIILGLSTFFLPCGFTQSMQIYSLTTGNFLNGALTMLTFALGTLPVLALISFASIKLSDTLKSGIFFKTAGFIILFFAIINFIGALAAVGLIKPFLNI